MSRKNLNRIVHWGLVLALTLAARTVRSQEPAAKPAGPESSVPIFESSSLYSLRLDLGKMEPLALQLWLGELANAIDPAHADQRAEAQRQMDAALPAMGRVRLGLMDAGAPMIFMSGGMDGGRFRAMVYAPIAEDAPNPDAAAVASLLYGGGGRPGGNTGPEIADAQPGEWLVKPFGGGVLGGVAESFRHLAGAAKHPSPEIVAAFASASSSAFTAVSVPTPQTLPFIERFLALTIPNAGASPAILRDVKRAVLTLDFPPHARMKLILDASPGSAAKVKETLDAWLKTLDRPIIRSGLPGLDPALAGELLSPKVAGDQLVIDLDDAALKRLVGPVYSQTLLKARAASLATRSMSNMRQILMGTIMFANENQGSMPDNFAQLDKFGIKGAVLVNPRGGKASPDYVYVKPADKIIRIKAPGQAVILYENPDDLPADVTLVNVGFADGHVEGIPVKDFNARIKPTLPATKPE